MCFCVFRYYYMRLFDRIFNTHTSLVFICLPVFYLSEHSLLVIFYRFTESIHFAKVVYFLNTDK